MESAERVEQQTIKRAIKKIVNRQIELPEKVTAEYLNRLCEISA